ncbi:probable terpene synthase 6 [Jatropha curcas]|uniref:probable terpene synthase 6 n=1 Tax=Jatropha curcas TaxID=180498 RepID=UPI0018939AE9|nr:probable terpene synthase 6 [Jatropha curcas]
MLKQSTGELIENIEFINLLYRLGISYHFEAEIEEQLNHIFIALPNIIHDNNYDLYTSALLFQVLRQHGYKMPCGKQSITIFMRFICIISQVVINFIELEFDLLKYILAINLCFIRWWKDLNLVEKLPYVRDRIVEVYIWAIGAHFEPQYALARVMITKYTKMVSVVDDTYDAYGTLDELQQFTIAVQRCNIDAIDQLPEYMKVLYRALLNLFAETENDETEGRSQRTAYAKETFKELVRAYFVEAKWFNEGYVPPFEEYISNGLVSSTYSVLPAASFIGLEKVVGSKEYEWVKENPKIVNASKLISRLMDDVTTHEHEQEREHCASGIECYMKEYGVSQKEAIDEIQKMCANAWKDINQACMKPTEVSTTLLKYYVNLARVVDFVYKYSDSYTYSTILKDDIKALFLEKLPM